MINVRYLALMTSFRRDCVTVYDPNRSFWGGVAVEVILDCFGDESEDVAVLLAAGFDHAQ